ncbi:MAG: cysteine--tRNA ligase [Deltaproteobacteria bacterium]|nr:MAG: cysteine--tRNA ligase [Deltaproteobacteria bacterium]
MSEAPRFRIYNTLSRNIEDFVPLEEGKVKLYVCGMTVYDHAHVGHARAMVVFDAFVRYLRATGWDVTFVRNFTDVDDKIIRRAKDLGEDPLALAERYIESFQTDTKNLGLVAPDSEPRVSTSIPDIIELIQQLIDHGNAYEQDGDVWFGVESFDEYGKLSGRKVEDMRSADSGSGKSHPADFALWKSTKPGEPSWESPWGPGRPGWHIECSAMSINALGNTFDIHGGGLDLVFPHHENEIAQSECGTHAKYVNYWMHNGLLVIDDGAKMKGGVETPENEDEPVKMGKSLGNVFNIRDALQLFPAEALRFYYLQGQYRSPLGWNENVLPTALARLMRLYEARERAENMGGEGDAAQIAKEMGKDALAVLNQSESFAERFREALANDFCTPVALSYLFELARAVNRFAENKKAKKRGGPIAKLALEAFDLVAKTIGIMSMDTEAFHQDVREKHLASIDSTFEEIEDLMNQRTQFREEKNWSEADRIRDELLAKQIDVMDLTDGSHWRVRVAGQLPDDIACAPEASA